MKKSNTAARKAQTKKVRHGVAVLKQFGLMDKKYDARSVVPTPYLNAQIKRFENVINGEAKTAKVSKEKAKYYKEQGYEVKNGRVVVPVTKNETLNVSHGDFKVITHGPHGKITRYDVGLSVKDITVWKEKLRELHPKLQGNERLAFQFYGNNSYGSFKNVDMLLDQLDFYPAFENAEASTNPHDHVQMIRNIVVFKVDQPFYVREDYAMGANSDDVRKRGNRRRQERYLNRMNDTEYEKYLKTRAEAERARRARMSGEAKEEYKRKANERAHKSIERRKPNGKKNSGSD